MVELNPDELGAADAVLLLVDHDAFEFDLITSHARYVLDTRHAGAGSQRRVPVSFRPARVR